MSDAASRREEWERLRAERAAARADLVRALDGVEEKARDPFGVKAAVRRHPYLTAGVGYFAQSWAIDLSYRGKVSGGIENFLLLGVRIFIN